MGWGMPPKYLSQRSAGGPLEAPEASLLSLVVNVAQFDQKIITLTDARLVGVMLRERRFSLREHSAITPLLVGLSDGGNEVTLQAVSVKDENNYVKYGDKGAFHANASKADAIKFKIVPTELGFELFIGDDRPSVFDDNHDVSVGKPGPGLSSIPLLIHMDPMSIWQKSSTSAPNMAENPSSIQGNTDRIWPVY